MSAFLSQNAILDNLNYANDPRVRAANSVPVLKLISELIHYAYTSNEFLIEGSPEDLMPPAERLFKELGIREEDLIELETPFKTRWGGTEPYLYTINVPFHWEVCDMCRGNGTVVNPSIDAGGLSWDDFDADPDFYDDYMSGQYDQPCPECNGRTTVQEINWDNLPEKLLKAVNEHYQAEDDAHAERMAEMRMGC